MDVEVHLIGLSRKTESRMSVELIEVIPLHLHGVAQWEVELYEGRQHIDFILSQAITLSISKVEESPLGDVVGLFLHSVCHIHQSLK